MVAQDAIPTETVVRRLSHNLAEKDHLLSLLTEVADGCIGGDLDDAVVLIPRATVSKIRQVLGR